MQKERADALERERDALLKQLTDLRDRLAKALSDLEEVRGMLEHMVPRYVCVRVRACVRVRVFVCACA